MAVCVSSAVVNGYDADPALIIQDFLTNSQYGVGFPPASIAATTLLGGSGNSSYQSYCRAAGLALSPVLTDQESARSILARWLQLTNTAAVWSSGLLKFIPYGDASLTGTLYSGSRGAAVPGASSGTPGPELPFPAARARSIRISRRSMLSAMTIHVYDDGKDPVNVVRSDPYAAYNMQTVEISQRSNYYDATPITAFAIKMPSSFTGSALPRRSPHMRYAIRMSRRPPRSSFFSAGSISAISTSSSFPGNIACWSRWTLLH